jgi:hypothetical protein
VQRDDRPDALTLKGFLRLAADESMPGCGSINAIV